MNDSLLARWDCETWNQWRRRRSGMLDVALLQIAVMRYPGSFCAIDVTLLGFGFALTRYVERAE